MTRVKKFSHNKAANAKWTDGLRSVFQYRDLGLDKVTDGKYVAHLIKGNGRRNKDDIQKWHIHHCDFQFVMVLNGWAEFEYENEGIHKIEKGDVIYQPPGIKHKEIYCSKDFEILEIVSPADFATELVDNPN